MIIRLRINQFIFRSVVIAFSLICLIQPRIQADNGIDELFIEEIGGVDQAILIRGDDRQNPVMLRLHGGPGYPYFPYLPKEGKLKAIESHFTMIYWEQRGTGASYSSKIRKKSMNTVQFVDDAYEVVQFAKELLGVEKVFVWGHSWGSNIGILLARKYPEEIFAYIGTGQSADVLENERQCYRFALKKTIKESNEKGYRKLSKIDTTDYHLKDALEVRRWIYAYGGIEFNNGEERSYVDDNMFGRIWKTPQYTFKNKVNIILHPYYSGKHLWDDMKKIDLFTQAPVLEVPVYFCLGRHDRIVSSEIACKYFNSLEAPAGKQLIWFEKSAHRPHTEETEKFLEVLVSKVLPETYHTPYLTEFGGSAK